MQVVYRLLSRFEALRKVNLIYIVIMVYISFPIKFPNRVKTLEI